MTVTDSTKSTEHLTLRISAEFAAGVERVWQIWADPRQLERWWGPPTWPATFEQFEFEPGGQVSYYMTGPDGSKGRGWWEFTQITAPHSLVLQDGFADDNGERVAEMGAATMTVTLQDLGGQGEVGELGERTRMVVETTFESEEQMQKMISMGMEEGMREAMGQIDAILAE